MIGIYPSFDNKLKTEQPGLSGIWFKLINDENYNMENKI